MPENLPRGDLIADLKNSALGAALPSCIHTTITDNAHE